MAVSRYRSDDSNLKSRSRPRGVSVPEVLVVVAILFLAIMVVLSVLPRRREGARLAGCRRNLMQIGVAVALYEKSEGRLPTVPRLGSTQAATGGPLQAILESLVLSDLTELSDISQRPSARPGHVPEGGRVPGFVCPSDRTETGAGTLPGPISYRATTGDDATGSNGGFAPGRALRLFEIEAGDGRGFTAAFSERLLGARPPVGRDPANYFLTPGPIGDQGCPSVVAPRWRNDAGSTWKEASWRSTLYTHALTPGAAPSCVAEDGVTALIGASSGHLVGVNVLIFDGSVRTTSPTVAPRVWKALATTHPSPTTGE